MTDIRSNRFLEKLLESIARNRQSIALRDDETVVSYDELDAKSTQTAEALLKAGFEPADRVAIVAENTIGYLVSVLGIWKAGGIVATIYPSSTPEDLRNTIWDSDPVLVLADEATAGRVREAAGVTWPVGLVSEPLSGDVKVATPRNDVAGEVPRELALICYSSGTTARPKAIMLSDEALLAGASTYVDVWRLSPDDVTLVCLPMAWLYGLNTSSLSTLLAGGTVVPLRRSRPEMVSAAISTYGVTVFPAVTTVLNKVTEHLVQHPESNLESLRLVVSGGEPRNEKWFALFTEMTGVEIFDTYCASESFPLITYDPVADAHPVPGSAGRLVPGGKIRILDAQGNPVTVGEPGEAESRGPGVMNGYWNDPDLTASAFTEDGWYKTKDLVRQDENGYFYVVGRASDLIIRGGSNISPAEVEHQLREFPEIVDAVVLGLPDDMYGEEVVAVIEWGSEIPLPTVEIQQFLKGHLASFKVPTRYLQMKSFPKNSTTGKTDRRQILKAVTEGAGK